MSFAYLWRREQKELLYEMANAGVNAVLIKIAAIGLKSIHLGKSIGQMYPLLCKMVNKTPTTHPNFILTAECCVE
jgi:diphthine-ammonia ligase